MTKKSPPSPQTNAPLIPTVQPVTPAPTTGGIADMIKSFLIGSLSGSIASCVIQPIDTTKVLIQVRKKQAGRAAVNLSPFHVAREVIQKDGVLGLYTGLDAAIARQFVYCGFRLGIYRYLEDSVKANQNRNLTFAEKLQYSLIAGAFGSFLANPTDVSLIRFQSDKNLPPQQRRNYKNIFDALIRISKEEGIRGLWRGATPTVWRAMSINSSQLVSYNQTKEYLQRRWHETRETNMIRLISSAVSGVCIAVISLPFDNVRTKLMSMKPEVTTGKMPYNGLIDCLRKSVNHEGVLGLWVGIGTFYMRIAPHAMITVLAQDFLHDTAKKIGY